MDRSALPSIDALATALGSDCDLPHAVVVSACRLALDDARAALTRGEEPDPEARARRTLVEIEASRSHTVINGTGVLLHTNLGRAPVHPDIAAAFASLSAGASNVEIDTRSGRRAGRHDYLARLLPLVTGAEAGLAVNNNAGALMLAIASIAGRGGRVAVSRGELIEIGGSFRLPDIIAAAGAELVEVGTTNRTRIADFARVGGDVDVLLKVHPSNYRIEGFQEEVGAADLAALSADTGVPFVFDVGSGLVDERAPWMGDRSRMWLAGEPGVVQAVDAGATLVLFSGDKLLGGPQGGLMVGGHDAISGARHHPMARALRLDGASIAALAMTLEMYLDQRVLDIPFWAMASAPISDLDVRARAVTAGVAAATVEDGSSVAGAGSVPGAEIPTRVIRLSGDVDTTWIALATSRPVPVISTRRDDAVIIDMRSVLPADDAALRAAIERAAG